MADLQVANPAEDTSAETVDEVTGQESEPVVKTEAERAREAYAAREEKRKAELEALRRENEAYKRRDEESKTAAEEARKAKLSDEARVKEERDQLAAEVEGFRMNALRDKIGREFNLREEMIPRLIGTDEAAIRADAEDLVQKGFTKARPKVGTPTNPTNDQGPKGATYTRKQLNDPVFFRANEKDIMSAMHEGRITD